MLNSNSLKRREQLKLAIIYPRLKQFGGAERVIISLAKNFDSVIFTSHYDPSKTYQDFSKLKIVEYGAVLDNTKMRNYEGILKTLLLDLQEFDFIMPHMFPNTSISLKHGKRIIWYCHSPLRAIYDLKSHFLSRYETLGKLRFLAHHSLLEMLDRAFVKNIAWIVCNSNVTKERIKRFYGREAEVVYPGVDIKKYRKENFENFLLYIGRLSVNSEFYKRPLLAIEAMNFVKDRKLYVVGEGPQKNILMKMSPSNVEFLGKVSDELLRKLYAKCLAVIYPSFNEEFGIIPIEAMASGKAVIACYDGGGVCETIVSKKTGFLTQPKAKSIANAIKRLDDENLVKEMSENCLQRAKVFSEKKFVEKMRNIFERFYDN